MTTENLRAQRAEAERRRRDQRRAAGVCIDCQAASPHRWRCLACRLRLAEAWRVRAVIALACSRLKGLTTGHVAAGV